MMRELSRGGTLVAANISALHNSRNASQEISRNLNQQPSTSPRRYDLSPPEHKRISLYSDRPLSTASETTERYSPSIQSSEEPPPHESGDSDSNEEDTVKCPVWSEAARASLKESSDSASSSSSSEQDDSDGREFEHNRDDICDADYRTLTPSRRLDTSTRRDDDFKWLPRDDNTDPLSMELRVDECSASLDRRKKPPKERADRDRKTRSSASAKPPQHPTSSSIRQSPRPRRPRHDEPPLDLQRRWNSYEHFRYPEGGWWPPMCWCHGPPMPPPPPSCCMHDHGWSSHPSLPPTPTRTYKQNDADDRVRRLEADKESLQLQVQVLSEQISAQSDKMNDLERALHDARQRLDDAEQRLQKEMLQRSSLETQKLELLSKLSEMRLRVAERGMLERSPPPPEIFSITRPPPPRTPPANYGRQIERNNHMYSSLPRSGMASPEARLAFGKHNNMVVAGGRGQSVPNLAEKEEVLARGSPSPSLREVRTRLGSGGSPRIEGGELARGPLRATAQPRLQRDRPAVMPWQTTDIKQWDCETTCGWLESLGLETYIPTVRSWLQSTPDVRGVIAAATPQAIEKELGIKHPMHRKKIVLAVTDLLGGHGDPYLSSAGQLDTPWVLRWLEDVGMCPARAAAAAAAMDGRCLHRLTHHDMYSHLKLHQALHALSIRRGIQVLRDNNFSPDTMIRRALDGAVSNGDGIPSSEITRWSTHRVMQWLNEIDLAEYAPNLRGSGVHGGLMLLEARFTAELLAALLNIPANKTLLRRHLTQRFNDLLGRDVIQQKRIAEQTLGYQPLTATTKYKVPKKSQFTLKRKKSKDEADFTDLVCPLTEDCSGDLCTTPRKTILYWIRRNEETGGDLTPHHRQLYQRATTANEDGAIVAAHTANPFRSTALTAADYNVTTQTIRRRLNAAGIKCRKPAVKIELTPQHAEARVGFCLEYYNFDWVNNTVIFVDEKCFKSSKDGKKILYRRDNERYEVPNVLKNRSRGRLSLGYWGWMSIALML